MTQPQLLPFVFATAAGVTLIATPVVRFLARRIGMVSVPLADRWHQTPTALLGGIGIFIGCMSGLGLFLHQALNASLRSALGAYDHAALGLVIAATVMFMTGLVDDVVKFRPATKLVLQVVAAAIAISSGVIYRLTIWDPVNVIVTIFWFLALTNALNLLDNMDGVAAGIGGIAAAFLAANFALQGSWSLSAVCLAVAGAAFGFLPYNFHKASIFMGDSGSLFLGSLLAGLGALFPVSASRSIVGVLFVPALVVIIPILDTSLVTLSRILSGRPVSQGGRDHTTHRLVTMGLSERQVASLLYGFAIAGGGVSLLIGRGPFGVGLFAGAVFLIGLSLLAAYLLRLHVYPGNIPAESRLTVVVSDILYKRRILEVIMDLALFSAAYAGAYLLRFDGALPAAQITIFQKTLAIAIAANAVAFALMGVYRGMWHHTGLSDLDRIVKSALLGGLLTIGCVALVFREAEYSRTVFVVDAMLVLLFTSGARLSFRYLEMIRRRLAFSDSGTLIYGAGAGGALIVREAYANPSIALRPIGFIDDDPMKSGRWIHGLPVLGTGKDLPVILARGGVTRLIFSTGQLPEHDMSEVLQLCKTTGIEVARAVIELRPMGEAAAGILSVTPIAGRRN